MPDMRPPRPGELSITLPETCDAGIHFIGRIRTPWTSTSECPKNSAARRDVLARVEQPDSLLCRIRANR